MKLPPRIVLLSTVLFAGPVSADESAGQTSTGDARNNAAPVENKSHFSGQSPLRTSQRYNSVRRTHRRQIAESSEKPRGIFPGLSRKRVKKEGPVQLTYIPKAASIRRIQNKGRVFGTR